MDEEKTVSVLMPAHNAGPYIAMAIRSALEQTYHISEVVVVDDGSSDDTGRQVQGIGDPRVRYFHQDRRGQAAARNKTLELASGEFVAFLDADDLWEKNKLELQMPHFDLGPEIGVVYSDTTIMDEEGRITACPMVKRYSGWVARELYQSNFVPMSSAVVRRRFIDRVGGFSSELRMGLDYDLWLKLSTVCEFSYAGFPLARWRIRGAQVSSDFKGRYQTDETIRAAFLRRNPGLIPPSVVRDTRAKAYADRGYNYLIRENNRWAAASDFVEALRATPSLSKAWKGLAKCAIGRY